MPGSIQTTIGRRLPESPEWAILSMAVRRVQMRWAKGPGVLGRAGSWELGAGSWDAGMAVRESSESL